MAVNKIRNPPWRINHDFLSDIFAKKVECFEHFSRCSKMV